MRGRERRGAPGLLAGLALAAVLAAAAAAGADPTEAWAGQAPLAAILAEHCAARAATGTLRARFVQTRVLTALGEEERSTGEILYRAPDALRWEYAEPDGSWTVLRGREGWAVFPGIRQVHRFELGGDRAEVVVSVVGFGACGPAFEGSFDFAVAPRAPGNGAVLTLVPRRAELAATFARIELALDPADHLPRRVVLHESSGDVVRLELREVRRNVPIDRSLFEFNTPKSYVVVP